MAEPTVQVPVSLIEQAERLATQLESNADAHQELAGTERRRAASMIRALLSQPTQTAEPSGTDALATDQEMAEYGEAERPRVPTGEEVANALRAEGWDRAHDDLGHVEFPNRNPYRDPSTIRAVQPPARREEN